jgi:uncharacterized protein with HEPN domain
MSQRDDLLYFGHMMDTARKVVVFHERFDREIYDNDEFVRLTLLHLIQIIGEAASRVSETGRTAHPEIPWGDIIGLRNRIVHDYTGIRDEIIWETSVSDVPALLAILETFVPPDPPE